MKKENIEGLPLVVSPNLVLRNFKDSYIAYNSLFGGPFNRRFTNYNRGGSIKVG